MDVKENKQKERKSKGQERKGKKDRRGDGGRIKKSALNLTLL